MYRLDKLHLDHKRYLINLIILMLSMIDLYLLIKLIIYDYDCFCSFLVVNELHKISHVIHNDIKSKTNLNYFSNYKNYK